jgi:hypothetical protein
MPGTERVEITGPYGDRYDEILTPQAIDLIAALHAELGPRRSELLAARRRRQAELSGGATRQLGRAARGRPGRPPGGDHRADGQEDDH